MQDDESGAGSSRWGGNPYNMESKHRCLLALPLLSLLLLLLGFVAPHVESFNLASVVQPGGRAEPWHWPYSRGRGGHRGNGNICRAEADMGGGTRSGGAGGGGSGGQRKRRARRRAAQQEAAPGNGTMAGGGTPTPSRHPSSPPANQTAIKPRRSKGDIPNVEWRAVSWQDLRQHPLYCALPPPDVIMEHLNSSKQFPLFRQDSWQWDALHQGRLTTSKVAGLLGFHETGSGSIISLPRSLTSSSKASSARAHLLEEPPSCYVTLLKAISSRQRTPRGDRERREVDSQPVWVEEPPQSKSPFPFRYTPPAPTGPTSKSAASYWSGSLKAVRMCWGNAQEATAILAAVNYLHAQNATVCEAGIFCLESAYPTHEALVQAYPALSRYSSLPLMGASPDGVIKWPDGTVSAFECKNHAPYRENGQRRQRPKPGTSRYVVADPGPFSEVAPWHVPQLCFHMLCVGPSCRSAVFCSSACSGTVLLRLDRDDVFIQSMLTFIARFYERHVLLDPRTPLPSDFFQRRDDPREKADYREFLQKAVEVGKSATVIARIPGHQVQRSPHNTDLFLD